MMEQMISHYTDGNKARFAKLLGVSPQTVSAWIARGTYDAEIIYAKCSGISASWLLSGEGSMLNSDASLQNSDVNEELIRLRAENDVLRELVGLQKKNGLSANVG